MGITLSDILLRDINAERSDALLIKLGTHGMIHVPKSKDIVAHFALDGRITIETEGVDAPTVLEQGEYCLLFYGSKHCIYADTHRPSVKGTEVSEWPVGDEPLELKAGHGKEKAKFISAALRLIHNPTRAHNENPLEGVLRLSKSAEHVFKDGVLLTNAEQIEASSRGPGASAFVNALMNLHLTHALRCGGMRLRMDYGFQELSRSPYLSSSEKSRAVATAVRLLNTHTEKGWTVAGLAQQVGQSRSTFAATFSACVGTGPMEYLNKVRMDKAAELLAEPRLEMPLVTIASRVGYGAASSFARAFKAHFGVSPRSFCSRYKNAL